MGTNKYKQNAARFRFFYKMYYIKLEGYSSGLFNRSMGAGGAFRVLHELKVMTQGASLT
jgi:hypothetical protein